MVEYVVEIKTTDKDLAQELMCNASGVVAVAGATATLTETKTLFKLEKQQEKE